MKKAIVLFVVFVITLSQLGCVKTTDKYQEFVTYVKENGVYVSGEYKLSKEIGELSSIFSDDTTVSICVNSSGKLYFEETTRYSDNQVYIYVGCNNDAKIQDIKAVNTYSTYSITSTATINSSSFGSSSRYVDSFYTTSAPLGQENSKALLAGYANILLSHISLFLSHINYDITMSQLGYHKY